jgi:hypothetical protein
MGRASARLSRGPPPLHTALDTTMQKLPMALALALKDEPDQRDDQLDRVWN